MTTNAPPIDMATATIRRLMGDVVPGNLVYLSGGYSNVNHRFDVDGESYVVRVVEIGAPEKHRDIEARYLDEGLGPDVVAFDYGSGDMISRWIDGTLIADHAPTPEDGGRYLRSLHDAIPTGIHRYDFRTIVADYLAGTTLPPRIRDVLEEGWQPRSLIGCHNDLNPWNVIRGSRRWYTLDWEFAGDNDPVFDVVAFAFGLGWDSDETTRCLAAYGLSVDRESLAETQRAFYLREYAWAVGQLARGNVREEIEAQRDDMSARL